MITHPCCTPTVVQNHLVNSPFILTALRDFWYCTVLFQQVDDFLRKRIKVECLPQGFLPYRVERFLKVNVADDEEACFYFHVLNSK